jgi:hypothetical protein
VTCYHTDLNQEALLHISGPDALSFLQGQLSCDTRKLTPERALPGIYCTPQGRVVCDFLLCQLAGNQFALRMRRSVRAAAAERLGKYIIFSKAKLDAGRDDWQLLACWGATAADVLLEIFGAVPQGRYETRSGDGFTLVQLDGQGEQFECYLDTPTGAGLMAQVKAVTRPVTASTWEALQIESGIARIEGATSGEFIPQALNYDITGHISFNKGCYTGQEVVARMHYKGTPKRRLYPARIRFTGATGHPAPCAGDPLYLAGTERQAGHVVNCARAAGDQLVALVTATPEGAISGLRTAGAEILPEAPPYPIPEQ